MRMPQSSTFVSDLSKKEFPVSDRVSGKLIHPSLFSLIKADHPHIKDGCHISVSELNFYREKYISEYLLKEMGEMSSLQDTVLNSLSNRTSLVNAVEDEKQTFTLGQKVADKVADFGGSWTFILLFTGIIVVWILLNVFWLGNKGFDPYPFILLNLLLSCLAALQAPVIMMSQNRQEEKDRDRAKKDYMINLKSELEIRILHEKLDHLIMHQQQELIDIQKVQIQMMDDILNRMPPGTKTESNG